MAEKFGYEVSEQTVDGERVVKVHGVDGEDVVISGDEYDEVLEQAVDAASFREGVLEYSKESAAEWSDQRDQDSARSPADEQAMETAAQEGTGEDNQQDQDPG